MKLSATCQQLLSLLWLAILLDSAVAFKLSTLNKPNTSNRLGPRSGSLSRRWMSDSEFFDDNAPSDTSTEEPRAAVVVDTTASAPTAEDRAALKAELLGACLGLNRGFSATAAEARRVQGLVELLEADNPNPMPTQGLEFGTSPLSGDWRLVYTNALDVLTVALVPAVAVGQVYQNINGDASEITNVIDLQPSAAPLLNAAGASTVARLKVKASGKVESGTRVAIKFISSEFSPRTFLGQEVSGLLPAPRFSFPQVANPIGWIENTYVDDSLRVCRAIGDNVFVLTRVSDYDE